MTLETMTTPNPPSQRAAETPPRLLLASTSPFRRALLSRLALPFEVAAPNVDEQRQPQEPPAALVRRLAEANARAVPTPGMANRLIIGSDQVACLDEEVLGKPGAAERAFEQLRRASGREVLFQTGLCLFDVAMNHPRVCVETYRVRFRALTDAEILGYIKPEQPFGCAGSFKAEGLGIALFAAMEGSDPSSLIGLPLIRLTQWLREAGVNPLTQSD